ncbi:MAG: hypothetical protein WBC45_07120 [Atribacterota bacterium]
MYNPSLQQASDVLVHELLRVQKDETIVITADMITDRAVVDKPGTHLFVGQIGWTPVLQSINGKIVFDGSIAPDIGIIKRPIEMIVKNGRVEGISGGKEAAAYEAWLKSFNHPQMLSVAHTGIGFNPGAAVVGSIIQDQRVLGSTTWGFGSIGAGLLPSDGIKRLPILMRYA